MERTPRTILIMLIGILFFLFITLFAYNRFGRYINGPIISEISIRDYQTIDTLSISINGSVENTQFLSINERPILLNKDNTFKEIVVVSPGLTIIELVLSDTFEKTKRYRYHIYSTAKNDDYPINYTDALKTLELEDSELINQT